MHRRGGGIELWLGCKETVLCVRFLCKNHPLTLPSWEPLLASLGSRQSCRLLPGGPCEGRAGGLPTPAGGTVRAQPRAHSAAAALKAAVGRAGPVPGGVMPVFNSPVAQRECAGVSQQPEPMGAR